MAGRIRQLSYALAFSGTLFTASYAFSQSQSMDGSCAEEIILAAAKKNVADNFHNQPESGGECAYGVRTSLQQSSVGGIRGGIGNAIDFLQSLPPYGFEDSGLRDPNTSPPGAIIIFSGPNSSQYLKTGKYGSPPGDWLGHVTIKGDDGYYYTDGRTAEPAIGWENGKNVEGIRDVAGIYVPGDMLVAEYADKCANMIFPLAIAETPSAAEIEGHRKASLAVRQFKSFAALSPDDPSRLTKFREILALARDVEPYDGEARLAHMLGEAVQKDPALQSEYDKFLDPLGPNDCKAAALMHSVDKAVCLNQAGATGQDVDAPKTCPDTFRYDVCVKQLK